MGIFGFENVFSSSPAKKNLIDKALEANARFGAGVIKTTVNAVGAVDTRLGVSAKLKAFEEDLTKKIELNYKKSMALYRTNLQEKEKTLTDQEKYLAHLFVQFDFKTLYLYNEQQDRAYVEKVVGFLKSKDIKTKINKYIKAVLLRMISCFEAGIDRGYQYYIANSQNLETGQWSVTISDKEKTAYQFLYEFAKDVLAYQMAIKEVDQELTTLKRLSDTIITYIKSIPFSDVAKEKERQKSFLEPLYQMAYFFKVIKLENFDFETILSAIKEKVSDVLPPKDPDLNKKYITFIINFASRNLPAPILWLSAWGFEVATLVTQFSLVFALKKIYPDIVVDTTKSQGQQLKEIATQVTQEKLKEKIPLSGLSPVQKLTEKIAEKAVGKVLVSIEEQFKETFSPTPYEGSGLISKEKEEPKVIASSSVNAENQLQNDQNPKPQKSFFDSLKDYLASFFNWMWE